MYDVRRSWAFKKFRDPASGLTHFAAAVAAAIGAAVLIIISHNNLSKLVSLSVYGLSLLFMFSASAVYHLVKAGPRTIRALRKLDHSAIYLLIAGTYTPLCFNLFTGFWKWGLLGIVWGLALAGVVVKLFIIDAPRWVNAGVYVLMGWLSLAAVHQMFTALPTGALVWLFLGGVIFTLGAVVYTTKIMDFVPGIFGFHEVWHVFVILGCLCHYVAILKSVV